MTQLGSPAVGPTAGGTLTADERAELLRLRREVDTLRTERPPRRKPRARSVLAVVLIVLACVPAPVAGAWVGVHNQVSNPDPLVRTMSPLIDDPDVQARLTDRLTSTVFQYV